MEMVRMTEAELQQGFRALADRARREPVTITTPDGRDELVVLSAEEYARLKRRDRRVGLTEELPEEWVEAVRNAKDSYLWHSEHLAGREEVRLR